MCPQRGFIYGRATSTVPSCLLCLFLNTPSLNCDNLWRCLGIEYAHHSTCRLASGHNGLPETAVSAREGPNTATRKPHDKQPYPDFHILHRHSPPPGSWDGPEWSIFGYICLKNIAVESAECLSVLYQDVMVCSSKAIRLQSVNESTGTWGWLFHA